jgi:hypothetical protein
MLITSLCLYSCCRHPTHNTQKTGRINTAIHHRRDTRVFGAYDQRTDFWHEDLRRSYVPDEALEDTLNATDFNKFTLNTRLHACINLEVTIYGF